MAGWLVDDGLFENRSGLLLDLPQVGDVGDAHHHFGGWRGGGIGQARKVRQ